MEKNHHRKKNMKISKQKKNSGQNVIENKTK